MDRWKSGGGKSQRGEEKKREDQRRESQKKEDAGARKDRKVAIHCVFSMICVSGGSKSRLAKTAGAEPSGQMRDEKLHAVSAKHMPTSKRTKHLSFGALLEVAMSKKCTPLSRSTFPSQNVKNTTCPDHFWTFRCRSAWQAQGIARLVKSEPTLTTTTITTTTTLHYTILHKLDYATLITVHYTTPHHTTLDYTTLPYITLRYTHYTTTNATAIALHNNYSSTTLQLQLQLHYTTLHPAVVGEVADQVTTATIVTTPKKHNSNHL